MKRHPSFLPFVLALAAALPSSGADPAQPAPESFVVGIKETPPFTFKDADGEWDGPVVWLVQRIADELGRELDFREADLEDIFSGVAAGTFNAGAAALSITAEREAVIDFTPAYFESGIGIATRNDDTEMWLLALRNIFSWRFLQIVVALLLLLAAVGLLVWLAERKVNREQFGGRPAEGIGNGLWWSAVTMTTVGYGDKTPKTVPGRTIGLVWMFFATVILTGFTAGFASSLTRDSIARKVKGPADLSEVRTGTVPGSTSALWLDRMKIPFAQAESVEDLLNQLEQGKLGAVVFDKPVLEYYAGKNQLKNVVVLDPTYSRENYAIALPENDPLRERIDVLLLQLTESDQWAAELVRVLHRGAGG